MRSHSDLLGAFPLSPVSVDRHIKIAQSGGQRGMTNSGVKRCTYTLCAINNGGGESVKSTTTPKQTRELTFSTTYQPMYPTPRPSHIPSMTEDFSAETFHNLLDRFILPKRVWRTRCGRYLGTKLLWWRNRLFYAGLEGRESSSHPNFHPAT